nr:zinc finger BED domain-containing protein RICESLEEPER 2-like [Tanacetum cinerariifolium]
MFDNTKKAQCIHCFHFFSKDSNSTLKNHISHPHCEALKRAAKPEKSSMSRDRSLFVYNLDVLREQFASLVIQRGLPFNHFDDEQTTKIEHGTWQMMKRVIAFEDFLVPHSGSALAKMLRNVFFNFNLESKIMSITLDNARNNTSAIAMVKPMKEKLKKNFERMLPIITYATALNPCFNVHGVEFLIESISMDLEFFDDSYASKAKNGLSTLWKLLNQNFQQVGTRLTPTSLEMCMCLKDQLDAQERKQDKFTLETLVDFEEEILDAEVQENEAIPLLDEETALDATSIEGSMSGPGSGEKEAADYGYDVYHDDY